MKRLVVLLEYQGTKECAQRGEHERVARLIVMTRDAIERTERIMKKDQ